MQNVFMTGGAGFLGRAILRWADKHSPSTHFTVYSRDEGKQSQVRRLYPHHRYLLGDVRDADQLHFAMAGHDTVIHAAAMKYVPEGERNVSEAIAVNVTGSLNVAQAAIRNNVERVVGISTDKACRPVNVYGITKLLMERAFQEHDRLSDTRFNCVRYGNVIGSTGSVVPIFRRQAREGTMTITDRAMTRFWLGVDYAVELVFMALVDVGLPGTVLIPRLPATTMATVAEAVAELEIGEAKAAELKWETIGQRFGEKVHEELLSEIETVYTRRSGFTMLMWAVTEGIQPAHVEEPYNSNTPDRWLTKEDFIQMLQEVPS